MFLKKNIWLIFYSLLLLGVLYLVFSIDVSWNNILKKSTNQLSYLNIIFSSSVTSTFDQQQIMLELLGQQALDNIENHPGHDNSLLFDKILKQNHSLIGFGLADTNGQLQIVSSNIDLDKMPNLKQSENSRQTFEKALQSDKLVIGKTYYLKPLQDWIIPIRKALRDTNQKIRGVMTAGIKLQELLPKLNKLNAIKNIDQYQAMLLHDDNFEYAYVSGLTKSSQIKNFINNSVPHKMIEQHEKALHEQLNITMADIKNSTVSAEYFAPSQDGEIKLFSLSYLPEYKLWSITFIPRSGLIKQLIITSSQYTLTFLFVFGVIYLLFRYIHNFEQQNRQQLLNQANHDFLTGLRNRLYLKHIEPEWINEKETAFSVFFMDLDNFKNINDSYGHSYGDLILKQVAIRLLSIFSEQSQICRQGGDEFIILCKKTEPEKLGELASKVLDSISKPYEIDNYLFTIGASIGICRYPQDGKNFDSLFSAADTAMYQAKNSLHNYYIFTDTLKQQIDQTSAIEQALHSALQNSEFYMVYQPQIASKGALYGVEALIRWDNPELGFTAPDKFIPIAEDSGLILELGHFIIEQSISDIVKFSQGCDDHNLQLSINISVRQFMEFGFLEHLKSCLERYKFPSRNLTLEITEGIFINDFDYINPLLQEIRALGIKISLDDFGTGFSSLSMLRKLPIDELKIDKSFIDQCTSNQQDKAMIINILNIARNLKLKVVAEGIENQQQASLLTTHRCDIQQGYLYSRPIVIEELQQYCVTYRKTLTKLPA